MTRKTLNDLFVHSLSDIYSAEKQLTKALAKLSRTVTKLMMATPHDGKEEDFQLFLSFRDSD